MKLSNLQLFWMIFIFLIGNILLRMGSPLAEVALQDGWMSVIIATLCALLVLLIASKISLLYPNLNFLELCRQIMGKWLGSILFVTYLLYFIIAVGKILAESSSFTLKILLPATPIWAIMIPMLMLIIYGIYIGGIEGIGRCSEVFGPINIVGILFLILLAIPSLNFQGILPVYVDSGFTAIIKGSIFPFTIFSETVIVLMLLPFVHVRKKGAISVAWGLAITGFVSTIIIFFTLMTVGPDLAARLQYPVFDMVRFINIMNFIQNLEIVGISIWILSVFIKMSVYLFLASYGSAQLFNMKDWRKTVWFVGAITLTIAYVLLKLHLEDIEFFKLIAIPYIIPINMIGIPLLLLIVGTIRNKKDKTRQQ